VVVLGFNPHQYTIEVVSACQEITWTFVIRLVQRLRKMTGLVCDMFIVISL
jgi:hypothetical protein